MVVLPAARDALVRRCAAFGAVNGTDRSIVGSGRFRRWWATSKPSCDQRCGKPVGRLLRIVGLLPPCSEEWKAEYKERPIIERYFSSGRHNRSLDTRR